MAQPQPPTLINLPQPPSNPDTPSEMPGTPTSTTTSLSALSTTAIKDGHRGHHYHSGPGSANRHQHHLSANSIEAERADRISRLPGFGTTQTRGPLLPGDLVLASASSTQQVTPTSLSSWNYTASPAHTPAVNAATAPGGLTPAYFDAHGQPFAATKMSTVGTASATEMSSGSDAQMSSSDGARTTLTETEAGNTLSVSASASRVAGVPMDQEDDVVSIDTNYGTRSRHRCAEGTLRNINDDMDIPDAGDETEMDSASGYMFAGLGPTEDAMDEDLASRSVAGFEERLSDDGHESLVGFGEGAGSTVSGPIYHRRPVPGGSSQPSSLAGAMLERERAYGCVNGLARGSSGLGEALMVAAGRRDTVRASVGPFDAAPIPAGGGDILVSMNAALERREARTVDGVAINGATAAAAASGALPNDDVFIDMTMRSPASVNAAVGQAPTSALRETQLPRHLQLLQQVQRGISNSAGTTREAVERIAGRLDDGEGMVSGAALRSPKSDKLGRFCFEGKK